MAPAGHYSFSKIVYNSINSSSKVHPPDKDMRLQTNEKIPVIKTLFYDGKMDCFIQEMKKKLLKIKTKYDFAAKVIKNKTWEKCFKVD